MSSSNSASGFVLRAMDNYFTLPKVIHKLREIGVGVVGTARFRSNGWPPKALKDISKDKARFNEFYCTIDNFGTIIARWMDNGMVFCVSTLLRPGNMIKRLRKRPRVTNNNKNHVSKIWGDKGTVQIFIPTLIDDWMGGVDLSDQRISYYHPTNLICQRTWLPIFLQLLSIIRNNTYLVHCQFLKKKSFPHKKFTLEMITWLMKKCEQNFLDEASNEPGNIATTSQLRNRVLKIPNLQMRKPSSNETLTFNFPRRFHTPKEIHSLSTVDPSVGRGTCVVCSANWQHLKTEQPSAHFQRETCRTVKHCSYCLVHSRDGKTSFLCKKQIIFMKKINSDTLFLLRSLFVLGSL